jgi:hypothetical protein
VDEDAAFQLLYARGPIGSFLVSLRAWAPDDFRLLGSEGMIGVRGSIVRPHGIEIVRQAPIGPDRASFGWKAKLRQNAVVHQIAQRLDRSGRADGTREAHRYTGNGYHYEADEVRACIERGAIESDVMPLADSVAVTATIDAIRQKIVTQHEARSIAG